MLNEEKIQEMYDRKLRLYDKTGNEKFLYQADVLQEVLEIGNKEEKSSGLRHPKNLFESIAEWNDAIEKRGYVN